MRIIASGYTDGYMVGLKGKTGNKGITLFDFDEKSGSLTTLSSNDASENPSFLSMSENGVLAACEKIKTCSVEGYLWDEDGKSLKKAGALSVQGTAMCHVMAWPGRKFASVSNYMTGDFAVVSLENGICPKDLVKLEPHFGVGFDSKFRQEAPHVHSTMVSPSGNYLLVADLGLDQVFVYKINCDTGDVELAPEASQLHTPPGEGPRHMAFSPDGKFYYLVTEMGCKLFCYSWDEENASFTHLQTQPLLPDDFEGFNLSADIHISSDGKFVYASNRGADSIAVFARDLKNGELSLVTHFKLDGAGPRNFCIAEDSKYLAAACQNSGDLLLYAVGDDGVPEKLLARAEMPQISFCGII